MKKPDLIDLLLYILIAIILTGFAVAVLAFAVLYDSDAVHAKSRCPEDTGCIHLNWDYYTDYEYGSKMYWWRYCTDMQDTIFECI